MRLPRVPVLIAAALAGMAGWGSPACRADFIVSGSFGPNGDIGFPNSPPSLAVTFGATGAGSIFQLDSFVNARGQSWGNNGSGLGNSAQLGYGTPAGLGFSFLATQPTAHQLLLTYAFTNNTGSALSNFQFLPFIDADIDVYFDNNLAMAGAVGPGLPDTRPASFEATDPFTSTLFTDLNTGTLNGANEFSGQPGNVALGLGFLVGSFLPGSQVEFQLLLSDDGTNLGGPVFTQTAAGAPADILTISGRISAVPEPATLLMFGLGMAGVGSVVAIRRRILG